MAISEFVGTDSAPLMTSGQDGGVTAPAGSPAKLSVRVTQLLINHARRRLQPLNIQDLQEWEAKVLPFGRCHQVDLRNKHGARLSVLSIELDASQCQVTRDFGIDVELE